MGGAVARRLSFPGGEAEPGIQKCLGSLDPRSPLRGVGDDKGHPNGNGRIAAAVSNSNAEEKPQAAFAFGCTSAV